MTDFSEARQAAGLTVRETASLLSVDTVTVRRWEMAPNKSTARTAPPLAIKVLKWFADGVPPQLD